MTPASGDLRLAEQIVRFARTLRASGVKVGPGAAMDAVEAVESIGATRRQDFYWTLHATLIKRHEDDPVFDQAFRLFWRRRDPNEAILAALLPVSPEAAKEQPGQRRVQEALAEGDPPRLPRPRPEAEREVDMRGSASDVEILRHKDFAQMTADELAEARRRISELTPLWQRVSSRRLKDRPAREPHRPSPDIAREPALGRRTDRSQAPRARPPPAAARGAPRYIGLHERLFAHRAAFPARAGREPRRRFDVSLRHTAHKRHTRPQTRDPDAALAACGEAARDWSGGTWISSSLHRFNKDWSRRVLGQGAHVLLITDGLEREAGDALASREMDRLHRSCRKLIWLNPLLRYAQFEPKAAGIRAMLPHVDELRPVHNLESLEDLCNALTAIKL
jgi:uncharacterized protein